MPYLKDQNIPGSHEKPEAGKFKSSDSHPNSIPYTEAKKILRGVRDTTRGIHFHDMTSAERRNWDKELLPKDVFHDGRGGVRYDKVEEELKSLVAHKRSAKFRHEGSVKMDMFEDDIRALKEILKRKTD